MTQTHLDRIIAHRTGESLVLVRQLGFHLEITPAVDPAPAETRLVVDCPSCRRPVPYPGRTRNGSRILAECADPRCDIYFDFDLAQVYAT